MGTLLNAVLFMCCGHNYRNVTLLHHGWIHSGFKFLMDGHIVTFSFSVSQVHVVQSVVCQKLRGKHFWRCFVLEEALSC